MLASPVQCILTQGLMETDSLKWLFENLPFLLCLHRINVSNQVIVYFERTSHCSVFFFVCLAVLCIFYGTVMVSLSLCWVHVVAVTLSDTYHVIITTKIIHCSTFITVLEIC